MPTSQPLKLWIPLDGGHVSDRAIQAACTLFARDGRFPPLTEIRLVRIVHPHEANEEAREEHAGEDAPLQVRAASAQHHLDRLSEGLEKRGAVVDTRVRMSEDPPAGLVEDMLETDPTLILMTSHARDGFSRWTHGASPRPCCARRWPR
ncbi:MAG: universal stress protein [Planctomycetota bacterium]